MAWVTLFELMSARFYALTVLLILVNLFFLGLSFVFYKKERDFNKAIAFFVSAVFIDVASYIAFKHEVNIFTARDSVMTVEGFIEECKMLGPRPSRSGAAEISVQKQAFRVDNFFDWKPCEQLVLGLPVRIGFVYADSVNVVVVLHKREN